MKYCNVGAPFERIANDIADPFPDSGSSGQNKQKFGVKKIRLTHLTHFQSDGVMEQKSLIIVVNERQTDGEE